MIYGCGPKTNPATVPGFFRIETDGSFKYYYMISSTVPTVDCRGVTYDAATSKASFLLLTNSPSFKSYNPSTTSVYDAVIVTFYDSGSVERAKQVSLSSATMLLGFNALSRLGQAYVFTGYSVGYTT
jgi:hypothetical protein